MSDNLADKPSFYDPTEHRIRSFVTRAGRLSNAQARAIEILGPTFIIPYQKAITSFADYFGNDNPVVLEIGFGMGDSTAKIAQHIPHVNFLAIEVHTPGVGNLLKLIDEENINNIRIMQHDAFEVLRDMIAPNSLAGVHVFFPDPWHKARHNKRRLIQGPFVSMLSEHLTSGGYIHCATDWEEYAQQMLEVLNSEPTIQNTAADYAPRPDYRPVTKFENRGLRLGHGVWDIVFQKK